MTEAGSNRGSGFDDPGGSAMIEAPIHKFEDHASEIKRPRANRPIVIEAEHRVILVFQRYTTDRLMRAAKEPRYAGRLVNDLASHHLRFSPSLVDSPLYDTFQKVLEGIESP